MKKFYILIIDDSPEVRKSIRTALCPAPSSDELFAAMLNGTKIKSNDHCPFDIAEASQGFEGVTLFEMAKKSGMTFDLVFVDMVMPPGIDGRETIKRIRQMDLDVPIIVFTAFHEFKVEQLREYNLGGREPQLYYKPIANPLLLVDLAKQAILEAKSTPQPTTP